MPGVIRAFLFSKKYIQPDRRETQPLGIHYNKHNTKNYNKGGEQVVGIDVGRDSVKVVTPERQFKFKSKVGEWRERNLLNNDRYEVELNGDRYFIADLAEESRFGREMVTESKIHEETRILFLSALALEPHSHVVTGLPIRQHTEEYKQQLRELLCGTHEVTINQVGKRFTVQDLWVVPEGAAVAWDQVLNMDGKPVNAFLMSSRIRAIDIGSRTINYCTLDKMKYFDKDSGTLPYGCLNLPEECDETDLEDFARMIVADLAKRWLGYKMGDVVLCAGGGSVLLKDYLKQHYQLIQFADEYSNVRGYLKMGRLRWQRENAS